MISESDRKSVQIKTNCKMCPVWWQFNKPSNVNTKIGRYEKILVQASTTFHDYLITEHHDEHT